MMLSLSPLLQGGRGSTTARPLPRPQSLMSPSQRSIVFAGAGRSAPWRGVARRKQESVLMRRFLWVLLAVIAAAILIPIGISNRQPVSLNLDPFGRVGTALALDMSLSLLMFLVFMLGLLVGGLATWAGQGKWRRTARLKSREAFQWKAQADRLIREQDGSAGSTSFQDGAGPRTRAQRLAHGR